ncbi:hypothetical protein F4808DRAFT_466300 [Astrocystis sublimbata]|nr:hypothetical protein F4808DRAFT_466300 [Astrocystis sublimbata]
MSRDPDPKVTDIHLDAVEPYEPYEPDTEEAKCYFHVQHEKCYRVLQGPDIIGKWCKELSMKIIEALCNCEWAYFFPIRTCLMEKMGVCREVPHQRSCWVAVKPTSLEWEEGIKIAMNCRGIMRRFMIFDVEVEIMEGQYTPHAASTELEAIFDKRPENSSEVTKNVLPMLSYSGYSIAYRNYTPGEGTVGLHIKLGDDDSTVYGLTCRHVIRHDLTDDKSCKPSPEIPDSEMGLMVAIRNDNNVSPPSEEDRQYVQKTQTWVDYSSLVTECLEGIEERKDRQIGHLAYCPDFSLSTRQPGYLKDWALVELDQGKFTLPLANRLFYSPPRGVHREGGPVLTLPTDFRLGPLAVSKMGQITGLTRGTLNGIEAVVRRTIRQ